MVSCNTGMERYQGPLEMQWNLETAVPTMAAENLWEWIVMLNTNEEALEASKDIWERHSFVSFILGKWLIHDFNSDLIASKGCLNLSKFGFLLLNILMYFKYVFRIEFFSPIIFQFFFLLCKNVSVNSINFSYICEYIVKLFFFLKQFPR